MYVGISVIIIIWIYSSFAGGSDYPAKITPKPDRGTEGAPVLIEEFSDLQCPACRRTHPILQKIMNDFEGKVAWRFYHFPLRIHSFAKIAAVGAECAADQGLFWEYVDTVYENQQNMKKNDLIRYATQIGADETFESCINSNTKNGIIDSEQQEGIKRRIKGTPTIFVNGKEVSTLSYDAIAAAVRAELK